MTSTSLLLWVTPFHVHHAVARKVFKDVQAEGWSTCPLTENAFLRVLGHPNYPKGPTTPDKARHLLAALTALPGHQFWSDSLSLTDNWTFSTLPRSKHLTDFYLLGLAVHHEARFASLDRRIDASLIIGGLEAYLIIQAT